MSEENSTLTPTRTGCIVERKRQLGWRRAAGRLIQQNAMYLAAALQLATLYWHSLLAVFRRNPKTNTILLNLTLNKSIKHKHVMSLGYCPRRSSSLMRERVFRAVHSRASTKHTYGNKMDYTSCKHMHTHTHIHLNTYYQP